MDVVESDRQTELLALSNIFAPLGLLEFGANQQLIWINPTALEILEIGADSKHNLSASQAFEALHNKCTDADHAKAVVDTASHMAELVYTDFVACINGQVFERVTYPSEQKDGGRVWRLRDISHIQSFFSTSSMTASYMEDSVKEQILLAEELQQTNQELAMAQRELEILATTDQLTGLPNRRSFFTEGESYLLGLKQSIGCVFLMADLDFFKKVNDTWGHACGDEAIKLFANVISDSVRPDDVTARMGGEEYAAILKDCTIEDAMGIAERIRSKIESTPLYYEDNEIRMTASIGLCRIDKKTEFSVEQALDAADQALYEAKETGRNKVCVFTFEK